MAKILCMLPNASDSINGVKFVTHKLGMISEELEDEAAEAFLAIKGYVLTDKKGKPVAGSIPAEDPPEGEKESAPQPAPALQLPPPPAPDSGAQS
jgi:hypothetical protein